MTGLFPKLVSKIRSNNHRNRVHGVITLSKSVSREAPKKGMIRIKSYDSPGYFVDQDGYVLHMNSDSDEDNEENSEKVLDGLDRAIKFDVVCKRIGDDESGLDHNDKTKCFDKGYHMRKQLYPSVTILPIIASKMQAPMVLN